LGFLIAAREAPRRKKVISASRANVYDGLKDPLIRLCKTNSNKSAATVTIKRGSGEISKKNLSLFRQRKKTRNARAKIY